MTSDRPAGRTVARLVEGVVATLSAAVFSALVIASFRVVNPGYFHVDDALNEFLPNSEEMRRLVSEGLPPILTSRALSGGNLLVDFGRGPFHPLNFLAETAWVTDNPHRVALVVVFLLLVSLYLGSYVLVRAGLGTNRLSGHAAGVLNATSPMFLGMFLPSWWNNGLGVVAFVWACAAVLVARRTYSPGALLLVGGATWCLFASGWPNSYVAFALFCLVVAAFVLADPAVGSIGLRVRRVAAIAAPVALGTVAAVPLVSEYATLGDYLLRTNDVANVQNFLTPSVSQLLGVVNPSGGDFIATFWGYAWIAVPIGFATLLLLVSVFFTEHDANLWKTDRTLQTLVCGSALFYLMTQLPSQLGPTRWSFRYLPYALALLVAACLYHLWRSRRTWSRGRFLLATGVVVVGALYAAWRVEDPIADRWHSVVVPLVFVVGTTTLLYLYRVARLRRAVEAGLVLFGFAVVWLQLPHSGPFFTSDSTIVDEATGEELAALTEGGFVLDAVSGLHANEWAPGYQSSRYLGAGVEIINGYDPVGHRKLSELLRQNTHGRLTPEVVPALAGSPRDAVEPGLCWFDYLRVTGVLTDADPATGHHAELEGCGFALESTRGNTTLFVQARPFADPLSTTSVAGAGLELSDDRLVDDLSETVRVENTGDESVRLVFARLAWPGYTAELDGRTLPVRSLDGILLEVEVPAGAQGVLTVRYEPVTWSWAWWLAAVGALGVVVSAFAGPALARPRRDEADETPTPAERTPDPVKV